jgi:pilus assembly protein CpaB
MVPSGMRAIAVDVSEASGLGGLLNPGCAVDVVSTLQDDDIGQQVARIIVADARVLAVGQRLVSSHKQGEEGTRPKTVSLLVTPREAEAIELACNTGRTRLVLRSSLDRSTVLTSGITLAELLGSQRREPKPVANVSPPTTRPTAPSLNEIAVAPRVPVARSVEVIRNGVATQVRLPIGASATPSAVTGNNNEAAPVFPGQAP